MMSLKVLLLCCFLGTILGKEHQKRLSGYGDEEILTPSYSPPPPNRPIFSSPPPRPGGYGPPSASPSIPPSSNLPRPPLRGVVQAGGPFELMTPGQMPTIQSVDVQCAMTSMRVRISFDRPFDGIIYAKGYFGSNECHFVPYGGNKAQYEFELQVDRCGTQFIDELATTGKAYLESILLMQFEPGLQEMWDTARLIQCEWNGKVNQDVETSFQVDMLDTLRLAYSGDDVRAEMDILKGRGPFAPRASGLLKIGDQLTLVIRVFGAGDMDVQVKDCIAHDGDSRNGIQLTDDRGCVVKRKLMGGWQFTKSTGNTGASLIAFAVLQAFRFPDKTDVYLQCSLEVCKNGCPDHCPDYPSAIDQSSGGNGQRRYRRDVGERGAEGTLLRGIRVVAESEIAIMNQQNGTVAFLRPLRQGEVCLTTVRFTLGLTVLVTLMLISFIVTAFMCLRVKMTKQIAIATGMPTNSKLG